MRFPGRLRSALLRAVVPLAALAWAGCDDIFVDSPQPAAGSLSVSMALAAVANGAGAAFDKADALNVRLIVGETDVVLDTIVKIVPGGSQTQASLAVPLDDATLDAGVNVILLYGGAPLFTGWASATLKANETTAVEVDLYPVVAAVDLPDTIVSGIEVGDSTRLEGAALFATGDTIPYAGLYWSTPDPNIVSVTFDGLLVALSPGFARVVAIGGENAYSDTAIVSVVRPTAPVQAAGLTATVSDTVVSLAWTDASANEDDFRVERVIGEIENVEDLWNEVGVVGANTASYTDVGAFRNAAFRYRVRACNGVGCSQYSDTVVVRTASAAPSSLIYLLTDTVRTGIRIMWHDPGSVEDEFIVQWLGPGTAGAWADRDTVDADTTYYDDFIQPNTTYRYRMLACNAAGCSPPSAEITINIPLAALQVFGDSITDVAAGEASLWGHVDNGEPGDYTTWWQWSTDSTFVAADSSAKVAGSGATDVVSRFYLFHGGATYWARLVAQDAYGRAYSGSRRFVVPPAVAPAVRTESVSVPVATNPWAVRVALGSEGLRGGDAIVYFEWATDPAFTEPGTTAPARLVLDEDCRPAAPCVSLADLPELRGETTYHVRAVAQNADDEALITYGDALSYTAPPAAAPTVSADSATDVTARSAVIWASGSANGARTRLYFQVSPTERFKREEGEEEEEERYNTKIVDSPFTVSMTVDISKLRAASTYYYRVKAVNEAGKTVSNVGTFSTS